MRRLMERSQRGAVAVTTALLCVVLIGFAAIAVDVGAIWWDKNQLQNGADAAALALAQSCARGPGVTMCESDEPGMATTYAIGNKADNAFSTVSVQQITHGDGWVKVDVTTTRQHWFAPVIGQKSSVVTASAIASWGGVGGGSVLPFIIGDCQVPDIKIGSTVELWTKKSGNPKMPDCYLTSGNGLQGNFGWLDNPDSNCLVSTTINATVPGETGDPGIGGNAACDALLKNLHGVEALVPIFDSYTGTGSNKVFHVSGYAVIRIDTYCMNSNKGWGYPMSSCGNESNKFITGTYIKKVSLDSVISPSAPTWGATTIQLTK